jgi:hypothetical protein
MIREAKKLLVDKGVLKSSVAGKPVTAHQANSLSDTDWRYLSASLLFK